MRLLFITDFTESFAHRLLRGIIRYANETEPWVVCRMPPSYKDKVGIPGVVKWARKWKADVVIGQFNVEDDVTLFKKNGIVAIAQDYKQKFSSVANITSDYRLEGRMAAEHFLERGFQNFAFFGYRDVCWSDDRYLGFVDRVRESGFGSNIYNYRYQEIDNLWYYEQEDISGWLKSLPKPIAIMACDDTQGSMLAQACSTAGVRIPYEVALIGVDNDPLIDDLASPTLSSIEVDVETGGYETARLARHLVTNPGADSYDVVLKPVRVVPRVSTAAYATSDRDIQKAIMWMHKNIDTKFSVSDVLDQVPLSRRLFELRFKQVTGDTVYNYIVNKRIDRFASLLLESQRSIVDIAIQMGEDDAKTIGRRFKIIKGMTPQEWRLLKNLKI